LERVSLSKPSTGSPSEETESSNPPGQLIFQYFEHETPYNREPLADKARCCYPLAGLNAGAILLFNLTCIRIS